MVSVLHTDTEAIELQQPNENYKYLIKARFNRFDQDDLGGAVNRWLNGKKDCKTKVGLLSGYQNIHQLLTAEPMLSRY